MALYLRRAVALVGEKRAIFSFVMHAKGSLEHNGLVNSSVAIILFAVLQASFASQSSLQIENK